MEHSTHATQHDASCSPPHVIFGRKGSSSARLPTPFVERSPFPGSNRVFAEPKEVANFSEMGDFLMIFGFTKNVPQVEGKYFSEI